MMRTANFLLALFLLLAAPLAGQELATFASLKLADYGRQDLLEARQELMSELVAVPREDDTAEAQETLARVLLELAELHLAQMLRAEAADYLGAVDRAKLGPQAQQRHRTLEMALALLGPREGLRQAALRSTGWTEGQALRAAAFTRLGLDDEAAGLMPMVIEGLDMLSPAMTAAILPDLLDAALSAQDWTLAEALAAKFAEHAELRDATSFRFLLARASELSGDMVMAFDGYVRAAGGRDAYAHRARLALVNLGRRTETLPLGDAVELLKTARWAWSGDAYATEGASLLADLALELGDTETALWALAQLLNDAPTPAETEAARLRARQVIEDFYRSGYERAMSIEDFVAGHATIMTHWRDDSVFVENAEVLPQTLLELGLTAFAAREFRTLRAIVEAAEISGDPVFIDRLLTQEARALLAGGQAAAAAELLARATGSTADTDPLLVQARRAMGAPEGLAAMDAGVLDPDARHNRAAALYEAGEWPSARQALLDLWAVDHGTFDMADATRLALAAHMSGDAATVSRAATALQSLSDRPEWSKVAVGLEADNSAPVAFNKETIRLGMAGADRALEAVAAATEDMHNQ